MENDNIIVGLDIGTTKIACFIGQKAEDGKVKILGFGKTASRGVDKGLVKNVLLVKDAVKVAVEQAANQANVDVEDVYVGVAGQHIKCRQNKSSIPIPEDHSYIQQSDLDQLIANQYHIQLTPGEEIIHVFAQGYSVDDDELKSDIPPVGVHGKVLAGVFNIVTANTSSLSSIKQSVESAGYKVKGVVLEPVASALAVLKEEDRQAGVALVDIGGGTTDIAIFHEDRIRYISVLPLAGTVITKDILDGFGVLPPQAESLKVHFGSCMPEAVNQNDVISVPGLQGIPAKDVGVYYLAKVIKARVEQILQQVNYEFEESGMSKKLHAGVILTGGGSKLQNIVDLTQFITTQNVRIGEPSEHLSGDYNEDLSHPMFATGIGLVLYGINELENKSDEDEDEQPIVPPTSPEPPSTPVPESTDAKPPKVSWITRMLNKIVDGLSKTDID